MSTRVSGWASAPRRAQFADTPWRGALTLLCCEENIVRGCRKGKLMPSGIFRRRKAAAAAALTAAAALGAGVPALVLSSSQVSARAAVATVTLSVSGQSVTFTKFGGITYDVTLPQPSSSSTGNSKVIATAVPPVITLRDPFAANIATYKVMFAWEQAARAGDPAARKTATLTLATSTGTTIATYLLENAFPTNLDVAAGEPQSTSFTVVLTGDNLLLESSAG
jgi:hypothetical protein